MFSFQDTYCPFNTYTSLLPLLLSIHNMSGFFFHLPYRTGESQVICLTSTFSGTYHLKRKTFWQRNCWIHSYNQSWQNWKSFWMNHWPSQGELSSTLFILLLLIFYTFVLNLNTTLTFLLTPCLLILPIK